MAQEEIAHHLIDNVLGEDAWLIGPGTTTGAVLALLGLEKTLLGVDVVRAGACLLADADERALLELLESEDAGIVVTPVGGQGFLFGRGNQQLSAAVLEKVDPRADRRHRHRGEDRAPRRSSAARRHRRSRHRCEPRRLHPCHRRLQPRDRLSGRLMTGHEEVTHVSDAPPANPYIPNSAPDVRRAMLEAIGVGHRRGAVRSIPERLRVPGLLDLPEPLRSEYELRRHVAGVLDRNESCAERLSFLGGGCWPHYVPAVCDEIVNRGEFLTAYYGDTYGDHGKLQALFEYASMLGELVECDAVSQPTYDWGAAAATADLHGGAHHRPAGSARAGIDRSRAALADRGLLRALGRAARRSRSTRPPGCSTSTASARRCRRHRLRVLRDARLSRRRRDPGRRRSPRWLATRER